MSTHIQPHDEDHESDAQALLMGLGVAMLVVTGLIIFAIVALGATAGMVLAYGGLIVATIAVFAFITKFIGPEDH